MRRFILVSIFLSLAIQLSAQIYQFRFFGREEGLPQPFIYSVCQTTDGYLWLGTGEGLSRYDGYHFKTFGTNEGLAEDFISTSFIDSDNQLWLGHNQGGVSRREGQRFKTIISGGEQSSGITAIREDKFGNIWASTQSDGVIRITKQEKVEHFSKELRDHIIYSLEVYGDDLLLATSKGLVKFRLSEEEPANPEYIPGLEYTKINYLKFNSRNLSYWVCTDNAGLFELKKAKTGTYDIKQIAPHAGLDQYDITHLEEDRFNNLWLSTFGSGLIQLLGSKSNGYSEKIEIDKNHGFPGNFIKMAFEDRERNIWVATYGNGLAMRTNDYFSFYESGAASEEVSAVLTDAEGVWSAGKGWVSFFPPLDRNKKIYFNLPQKVTITSLFKDSGNNILAGTEEDGIWFMPAGKNNFHQLMKPANNLEEKVTSITESAGNYYAATLGGILKFNNKGQILNRYSTYTGLLHNNVNQLARDPKGNIWIAGMGGRVQMLDVNTDIITGRDLTNTGFPLNLNGVVPTGEGIWVSTNGGGVYLVKEDSIINLNSRSGLGSNYCYGIVPDKRGYIWVMHRNTLSRIARGDNNIKLYTPGGNAHQDLGLNSADPDKYGNLWFASDKGLIRYSPDRDQKNMVPPLLGLTGVVADEQPLKGGTSIPEVEYDTYKIRFDVQGLSLRDPQKLQYRYKLEGYDRDWSDLTKQSQAVYTRLPDGEYTFVAEVFNADGIRTGKPLRIPFIVNKPFWKKWWFGLALVGILFQGVIFMVRIREKKHRQMKQLLKDMLDERTKEVTDKKDELERKNKDITDSISYARRIQWAVLPTEERLREYYPESFIFYRPKDIVSGDFYWMKKFSNKLLLACADATGHGVPGAFMSLIGSTLLKDITELNDVSNPSEVLEALDEDIKGILSQHGSGTNDGMDIALCEFDLSTNLLRFSLAMRPLVIVKNGEAQVYRGDRKSIGGKHELEEKPFTCHSVKLEKGDQIFMFSDGYHDQFGGETGKKLKMRPFIKLLEEASHLPASRQGEFIKDTFENWKRNLEQVDDVLVIGVKIGDQLSPSI